jgi:putative membrane protein
MKKTLVLLLAAGLMLLLTGCAVQKAQSTQSAPGAPQVADTSGSSNASQSTDGAQAASSGASGAINSEVIELTEKMYVTYINEIYTNFDDYLGRTIKLAGAVQVAAGAFNAGRRD